MLFKLLIPFTLFIFIFSCSHEQNPLLRDDGVEVGQGAPSDPDSSDGSSTGPLGDCTEDAIASSTIILGTGSASDPSLICNVEQLQNMNLSLIHI